MLVDGVHVGAAIDEELHNVDRKSVGDGSVHQWCSAERIVAIGVRSTIEQSADIAQIGKNDGVIERSRKHVLIRDLLKKAIKTGGAMSGDGHGEACFAGHFGVRSVVE